MRSGKTYSIDSPPANAAVTKELTDELQRVLERFAVEAGGTQDRPICLFFKPGIFGHHQVGRAADIYAVNGIGLDHWKQRWDEVMRRSTEGSTPLSRRLLKEKEEKQNLGWRLYMTLQRYGQWSQPYGYPIQLFGPWTRTEGPWKHISDRLLYAHRDHIHVAK